jgi:hypothetical protein
MAGAGASQFLDTGQRQRRAKLDLPGEMSNDEILMTNQCPNDPMTKFRHSSFVINWSFVLGHWTFFLAWLRPVIIPIGNRVAKNRDVPSRGAIFGQGFTTNGN